MPDVYVITESDALAASLERYFKFTRGRAVIRLPYPPSGLSPADEQWTLQTFRRLADAIEVQGGEAGGAGLQGSIAIIDLWDNLLKGFEELNPLSTVGGSWAAVVAMLVLAFPEIQWVFNTPYEPPPHFLLREAHFLRESELGGRKHYMPFQTLHDQGFVPLFDPTQLRNNIRQKIKFSDEEGRWIAPYVPARPRAAASIDEEEAYAYFNAYVAYRFGFRSHVVTSYAMMAVLLADDNQAESPPPGADISLAFEDVYLSFPDQRPGSNLRARDDKREFRKLRGVPQRIFVTVGHHRTRAGRATSEANSRYLREARARGLHWRMIFKPVSGIFDVWKKSGLRRAAEFKWPPEEADYEEDYSGHSASGRLLLIASRLIQRAERVLQTTNSVPAAVHGAVLALEALEYLGHRTPTTSLEALALKHKSEVQIECMFYGIEYHMDVKSRLKEIEQEVKSVGRWFRPRTRKLSTLNAEMRILSELVLIFRNYNQFDEEQECLARVRDLYRRLWFERHKRWAWLFYPTHWYVDFLLGSLLRFGFAIGFWIISLGFLFNYFRHQDFEPDIWWHGFADSMVSFFGLQPPAELKAFASGPAILVCAYAIILGFIHLGIFISHLYSMIARR